jgi:hypothetical protein
MEPVELNFAVTREDCMNGAAARLKMQADGNYRLVNQLAGAGLLVIGVALFLLHNATGRPFQWLAGVCTVLGAFLLFVSYPFQEASVRRMAAVQFQKGQYGVAAQQVIFREDCVEFHGERYEAKIPYEMLFSAYADETSVLLCTAPDESRLIPKRTMSPEEQERVEHLLAARLDRKFKQEGARKWMK